MTHRPQPSQGASAPTRRPARRGRRPTSPGASPWRAVLAVAVAMALAATGCAPADPAAGLRGSRWTLAAIEPPRRPAATPVAAITLVFDARRDEVTGSSGCNRFRADYRLDGAAFTLAPIDTSRMVCGNGRVMANERDVMLSLETAGRLTRDGDELWIDAAGGWRLRFARADGKPPSAATPGATAAP